MHAGAFDEPDVCGIGLAGFPLDAPSGEEKASEAGAGMSRNDGHLKMPANRAKPLLLVDVDGVISLFGFAPDERPAGSFLTVDGILHYLSAAAGDHLRRLSSRYELVWCTGWEERANEYLPHALGLPEPLHHLTFAGAPGWGDRHWKLDAIDAHAGRDRPVGAPWTRSS